jgi:transmembrane sensor
MDEIIIRSLQGRSTPAEEESLRRWRQESLQNERYYRDMARTWRLAALIEPAAPETATSGVPPAGIDSRQHRRPRRYRAAAAALAAAAMVVVGIGIGVLTRPAETLRLAAEEFVTGRHEMVTMRLTDGTVVRLAPNSRLRVGQQGQERQVWLDGRGFFAVAKDSSRAFVVRTRTGDAVVLGTRFDVNVDEAGMQVFVVEGRVAHQAGGEQVEVGAMQISRVTNGGPPEVEEIVDSKPLLSWLGEFLVFQATPMNDVAQELERRFGVQVQVADPGVGGRTVTAWFTDESLEEVLLIVCRAADAHCSVRDGRVSIEP